jgi:isoleucyl-tRNA synthetase
LKLKDVGAPFKGTELKGRKYVPLFNYFTESASENAFTVLTADFVTATTGTGLVHMAPGFGEDDFNVCVANKIVTERDVPVPLDPSGRFVAPVTDYLGMHVKAADDKICEDVKKKGRLLNKGVIIHEYPHCWRSQTPLIYRAVISWFVAVKPLTEKLLENNKNTYWVPDFIQEKRFANWLKGSVDWCISRSRYWGTPIPMWVSDDHVERVVVGSVKELEELSGVTGITDLHRENIDHITIPSKTGRGTLHRIEDIFDCWFESGSMPYAQSHYPFENKENFEEAFPADFIAEGLDQTRGWFYTLLVLGTALFDTAPFKNVIVNGIVLNEKGVKMNKRDKNYPDPMEVINEHGSDALRLYLINSPAVRAENLKFNASGVRDVVREVLLLWSNAYRFFVQNAKRYKKAKGSLFTSVEAENLRSDNIMDKWIISLTQSLVKHVHEEMKAYRLYGVLPRLVEHINQVTNWYVRLNYRRLKGNDTEKEWYNSLATLFTALYTLDRIMSPFTPFLTETMYQNLKNLVPKELREDSVHYLELPQANTDLVDTQIEEAVTNMQVVVESGRMLRQITKEKLERKGLTVNLNLRQPVSEFVVASADDNFVADVLKLEQYVKEELNTVNFKITTDIKSTVKLSAQAENGVLGPRLGTKLRDIREKVKTLTHDQVCEFVKKKQIEVSGEVLGVGDLKVVSQFVGDQDTYLDYVCSNGALILVNFNLTTELKEAGKVREVCSGVQRLRKEAGLVVEDEIDVYFYDSDDVLPRYRSEMEDHLRGMNLFFDQEFTKPLVVEGNVNDVRVVLVRR